MIAILIIILIVSLALSLLVYYPNLSAAPIYDDLQLWMNNDYRGWTLKRWRLRPRLLTQASYYLTFQFVPEPYYCQVFHLTNALAHWLGSILTYAICRQLGMDYAWAGLSAWIYTVHPLATSAVAPIAQRANVFATVVMLLSFHLALAHIPVLPVLVWMSIILFKEEQLTTLPALLLLVSPLEAAGLIFLMAFAVGFKRFEWAYSLGERGDKGMKAAGLEESFPQPVYTITAITENLRRLSWWLVGVGQNADPKVDPTRWFSPKLWMTMAALPWMGLTLLAGPPWYRLVVLMGLLPWAAGWFIRLPDCVAEYRAYSMVFTVAVIMGGVLASYPALAIPIIGYLAVRACMRTYLHRHPLPFWLGCWRESKPKLRVAINIGAAYQQMGDLNNAMKWHKRVLELSPTNGIAYANTALCHEGMARSIRQQATREFIMTGKNGVSGDILREVASHLEAARSNMDMAVKYSPEDPMVQYYSKVLAQNLQAQAVA